MEILKRKYLLIVLEYSTGVNVLSLLISRMNCTCDIKQNVNFILCSTIIVKNGGVSVSVWLQG